MITIHKPEFDPEQHAYCINGKPTPSVTEILGSALGGNPFWTQEGREAGRATHAAIHYYCENDLDYDSLDEATKPRLDAYIKFCADTGFKPDLVEVPMYDSKLLYCGTADQIAELGAVVDFKNGAHMAVHALQLAAYAHMLPNPLMYERWGVHLKADGKYDLKVYPKHQMTADFNIFCSCLNIFNWRNNVGIRTQ